MTFFKGETKLITIYYTDSDDDVVDMSAYTFALRAKESDQQATAEITVADSFFNKTNAATGEIVLTFAASASYDVKTYLCQISATNGVITDLSGIFMIEILEPI